MIRPTAAALALVLSACSSLPAIDHAAIDARAHSLEPQVARDCQTIEVAGDIATVVSIAVPGAGIVGVVVNQVCDDPAQTARARAIGEEIAKRLRDQR